MIEHRAGGSCRSSAVHKLSRVLLRPTLAYFPARGPVGLLMPLVDRGAALLPRLPAVEHEHVRAQHWRGELVRPRGSRAEHGAILYLHGGAFLFCGLGTHRRIVERLALRTGLPVLSVEYRQLPQGRIAHSISDSVEAFQWLVSRGIDPSTIVLAGDSAGGHLAFAVALHCREHGLGRPAGIVALSPWLDFDHKTKTKHPNADLDAFIPARRLRSIARRAVGSRKIDPAHSPVNADLTGLPPTLIICAEGEVLRADGELMRERLRAAGVPVKLQLWAGQVHAFPVMGHLIPESRAAIDEIASFTESVVGAAGSVTEVA